MGLNSNLIDLVKWELDISSGRIIKHQTFNQLTGRYKLNDGTDSDFGLGWVIEPAQNGDQLMAFGGGNANWHLRYINEGLSVILLTNLQGAQPINFATTIASFYR